jgi:hypothetical protein
MGLEATCEATFGRQRGAGKAHLDPDHLDFRGDFRLRIPVKSVTTVEAKKGELRVEWPEGVASFQLGADAEKWRLKIRYPRSLLDKLGVKPDARIAVLGRFEPSFLADLRSRTADVSFARPRKNSELIFVGMSDRKDLARLRSLRETMKPEGGIWVVWPKGRKEFREDDVRAAGPSMGLVDVKVVAFSDTLSALKMVIPVKLRDKTRCDSQMGDPSPYLGRDRVGGR